VIFLLAKQFCGVVVVVIAVVVAVIVVGICWGTTLGAAKT
jgi:hypothetical protein